MALALTAAELRLDDKVESSPDHPGELDAGTLARCRAGDPQALRRFVLLYQRPVFAFVSRMMGRGPHVEDVAQEVFLRAYRALPQFELRPGVKPSTWLLTIALRLVQDARKRRLLQLVPLTEHTVVADPTTPETEQRTRELAQAFERAAALLSDEQRAVFVLAHFHGLELSAIAELVGVPENTVKTRLFRARERLRTLLDQEQEAIR
jgi:RNA polymerase sigma-70 factor (ECF subfamily)